MSEKNIIAEFTQALDLIIKGDYPGICIKNEENQNLLTLVGKISKIDYCGESKIKDLLKEKLIKNLQYEKGELSDTELDYAAGGLDNLRNAKDPEN